MHPYLQNDIENVLVQQGANVQVAPATSGQGNPDSELPSTNTIFAWLVAGQNGDTVALANLSRLQSHIKV